MTFDGGKKYESPENIEERKELYEILRDLDPSRFKSFISSHVPELVKAGWVEKTPDQITLLMHQLRAQYVGLGEDHTNSRNFLRAVQFGYGEDEVTTKPPCASCKWFREAPSGEEKPCMHLGSMPQDIACRGYVPAEKLS